MLLLSGKKEANKREINGLEGLNCINIAMALMKIMMNMQKGENWKAWAMKQ
jgi:hypothetical protein